MTRVVRIAVVDSGIDETFGTLKDHIVESVGLEINEDGYIVEVEAFPEKNMHGTVVACIIQQLSPNVEFINVKVLDEELKADSRVLLNALCKVFDYQPDIIHMSLGTQEKKYIPYFEKIVEESKNNHVMIVAAADNSGNVSYPAYLNGVIGVKADNSLGVNEFYWKDDFFYGPAGVDEIVSLQTISNRRHMCGSSMAAAYITAHICNCMQEQKEIGFSYVNLIELLLKERKENTDEGREDN